MFHVFCVVRQIFAEKGLTAFLRYMHMVWWWWFILSWKLFQMEKLRRAFCTNVSSSLSPSTGGAVLWIRFQCNSNGDMMTWFIIQRLVWVFSVFEMRGQTNVQNQDSIELKAIALALVLLHYERSARSPSSINCRHVTTIDGFNVKSCPTHFISQNFFPQPKVLTRLCYTAQWKVKWNSIYADTISKGI